MSRKRKERVTTYLEPEFQSVLVCKENKFQPFIEILSEKPENVSQENLGMLFGIFEITDNSEDSSYIVNYLISIIKKEFFSKDKRDPVESLEASLHRANLALAKLVEHENVNWMGKINAICAVLEKENFHFSQTGKVNALLVRSKSLTNLSEGMSEESNNNPLKTFVDISSGKLEENDKIILSTKGIFEIFSEEEIKKSALRFSQKDFLQFLKTALGNELEREAVLVIDLVKKEEFELAAPKTPPIEETNVFSQKAFQNNRNNSKEKKQIVDEIKNLLKEEASSVQKNGHIYIKEDVDPEEQNSSSNEIFTGLKEKIESIFSFLWLIFKTLSVLLFVKSWKIPTQKLSDYWQSRKVTRREQQTKQPRSSLNLLKKTKNALLFFTGKVFLFGKRIRLSEHVKKLLSFIKKISTHVFRAVSLFAEKMTKKQKLYFSLSLLAIISIGSFLLFFQMKDSNEESEKSSEQALIQNNQPKEEQPQNTRKIEATSEIYSSGDKNIFKVVLIENKPLIIEKSGIFIPESNEKINFPDNFGDLKLATTMHDLRLIFLLNSNSKLVSFSPITKKFQDNILNLPEGSNIKEMGTYLTYIYTLDSSSGQIFRFPRAEGGFGEKTNWLKDSIDVSGVSQMAINENLYALYGKNILQMFSGKNQGFGLTENNNNLLPDLIYAPQKSEHLYAIDKSKGLLAKIDSSGKILSEYYNPELKNARDFSLDEQNNKLYWSDQDKAYQGQL